MYKYFRKGKLEVIYLTQKSVQYLLSHFFLSMLLFQYGGGYLTFCYATPSLQTNILLSDQVPLLREWLFPSHTDMRSTRLYQEESRNRLTQNLRVWSENFAKPGQISSLWIEFHPDCNQAPPVVVWQSDRIHTFSTDSNRYWQVLLPISIYMSPGNYPLDVVCQNRHFHFILDVHSIHYPKSKLQVARRFAHPPPKRAEEENQKITEALRNSLSQRLWYDDFHPPIAHKKTTSIFGVYRTYNDKVLSRHLGQDFSGRVGDRIYASNDGVVRFIAHDFFYIGNAVFIDHGQQLFTMYFHLSRISAELGKPIKRGDYLGDVGNTGRVTGPHLHVGVRLYGIYQDPESLWLYKPHLMGPSGLAHELVSLDQPIGTSPLRLTDHW
jgi:murein DD-endopeptidase MepM/ murein hydrolase activator NlpD